jgi:menaquinone-specific isochorismate synthase
MSAAMPVIPCGVDLLADEKELYQFLLACQEKLSDKEEEKIVSFSQKIKPIDPLAVFAEIAKSDRIHFYWENPKLQEAIVACGTAKVLTIDSWDRFNRSQEFIADCFGKTIVTGDRNFNIAIPRFWCSFTFFPESCDRNSPFKSANIFLPRFEVMRKRDRCTLVTNLVINSRVNIKLLIEQLRNQIRSINWSSRSFISFPGDLERQKYLKYTNIIADRLKNSVSSALKLIEEKKLNKIVLAQALDVNYPVNIDLIESLNNLRQRHPDCYIFSTSNGRGNHFIGASPERLISIHNRQLITDALAGSAPRGTNLSEDTDFAQKLLNSDKERREHQLVIDFITQRLRQIGLTTQIAPLQILQLSNIQHLWTPISARLPSHINPLDIVAKLHPTPAVAGVPTEFACEQIRLFETFDRSLYAGPIGWVDCQGNGEFIVGIRSASIEGNKARLYAGAGIVAGSDPDKELAEIQLKLQSLFKALV